MNKDVLSFKKVTPDKSLIDEIWSFNVKNLQNISDQLLSQYIIALGQWLVYFKSQTNNARAELNQLQSDLEFLVSTWIRSMSREETKEFKTKTELREYVISSRPESSSIHDRIKEIKKDLVHVDGIDKAVTELMTAFKRELTRRENELWTTRRERS